MGPILEAVQVRIVYRRRRLMVGVATAALLVLAACDGGVEAPMQDEPASTAQDTNAEEIASSFLEAIGSFDADGAIAFLADDANIVELTSLGTPTQGTLRELRLLVAWFEATRYRQMLNHCEELESSTLGSHVRCTFDFHLFGSDKIGVGPFGGSSFDLTVRDGAVARASVSFEYGAEFGPQMWDPFEEWVSTTYSEDAAVMYADQSHSGVRLTKESVDLWREHIREYVKNATAS